MGKRSPPSSQGGCACEEGDVGVDAFPSSSQGGCACEEGDVGVDAFPPPPREGMGEGESQQTDHLMAYC